MKSIKILILFTIFLMIPVAAYSQCSVPSGFVCITQETADRTAKALDELAAARVALAKYAVLVPLTEAERAAYQSALKAANDAFEARGKVIVDMERINVLQQKVVELYANLVEKLTNQLNRPRSAWSKFLAVIEKILYIAAGVSLGRGL